jgi:hypothetical protein
VNLPHHRHHPQGRELEWALPLLMTASTLVVVSLVVIAWKALA